MLWKEMEEIKGKHVIFKSTAEMSQLTSLTPNDSVLCHLKPSPLIFSLLIHTRNIDIK